MAGMEMSILLVMPQPHHDLVDEQYLQRHLVVPIGGIAPTRRIAFADDQLRF